MVRSFFVSGERVEELGPQPDMAAASRALPHGSYTTLRTYAGDRVLRLRQHAERLWRSLPEASPLAAERLRTAVVAALRATRFPESRLRLTYAPPDLFVSIEALAAPAAALYEQGVRCGTLRLRRHNPRAKDTHFIDTAAGSLTALPPDANEGLMVAEDGAILEGLSSNFFAVLDGELRTEEERVLAGVTRAIVLEIARGLLPVRLEPIGRAQLGRVSEAFLTSVSREILPVVVVDAVTLGNGRPGPVTRELILRFRRLAAQEAESLGTRNG